MVENIEETPHIRAIRNGMIKYIRRYIMDMDFMKNIVLQNPESFESKKDILLQFDRVKNELQAVLDYNFYSVEVEAVDRLEEE